MGIIMGKSSVTKQIEEKNVILFDGIRPSDMEGLLSHVSTRVCDYEKGETIIMEEEEIRYVGIVLEGRVNMIRDDVWGESTFLAYMGQGELFGETFHIMKENSSKVTFRAGDQTRVLFLALGKIMHPCSRQCPFHVHLADNLYDLLGRKNTQFIEKIEILSKPDLPGKILAYLAIQAEKQKSHYLEIPLNREEMAEYLCANRSALSRELAALKKQGKIDYHKNRFVLLPQKENGIRSVKKPNDKSK